MPQSTRARHGVSTEAQCCTPATVASSGTSRNRSPVGLCGFALWNVLQLDSWSVRPSPMGFCTERCVQVSSEARWLLSPSEDQCPVSEATLDASLLCAEWRLAGFCAALCSGLSWGPRPTQRSSPPAGFRSEVGRRGAFHPTKGS